MRIQGFCSMHLCSLIFRKKNCLGFDLLQLVLLHTAL
uniref:Uncharacterized protein n=1 Tax=Rhizophora mucronata TaxID=61149 RepID=A0A2P2NZ29_RHIMU